MELYTLDSLLRRESVVDRFESCIWTERWQASGDFELTLKSTLANRSLFTAGTRIAMNLSRRVMTVESVQDKTNDDGLSTLTVTGHSLEKLLDDRVVKDNLLDTTVDPNIKLVMTPGNVARQMFDLICRTKVLSTYDGIPFLQPGSIMPASTILENSTVITWEQEVDTLYNSIKAVCEQYDLGFRLLRNADMMQLYFDVYAGHDRTTQQTVFPPVVFAPNFDNLQNTTELTTIEGSKNVALVVSDRGTRYVYPDNVAPDVEGFERRVLLVKVNLGPEVPAGDVQNLLNVAGLQELSKVRSYSAFDGELNERSNYTYGLHYELGDRVEQRTVDGVVTFRRVTEQIFAQDEQGERSYPTLATNYYVNEGSWLSFNDDTEWLDYDASAETWANMP